YYSYTLIFITVLITCVDFNIYTEWGTKINGRVLELFFSSPAEAMASTASSPLFSIFLIAVILILLGCFLVKKFIITSGIKDSSVIYFKIPTALLILGFTFLGIRGGWGIAPMNP